MENIITIIPNTFKARWLNTTVFEHKGPYHRGQQGIFQIPVRF